MTKVQYLLRMVLTHHGQFGLGGAFPYMERLSAHDGKKYKIVYEGINFLQVIDSNGEEPEKKDVQKESGEPKTKDVGEDEEAKKGHDDFVCCEIPDSRGEICGKKLNNEEALRKHMEGMHLEAEDAKNPKVICPECGKEIKNLSKHIKLVHKKERSHEREECVKTYQLEQHLRDHIQGSHFGLKVGCDECGEIVTNIHSHKAFVHKRVKNFPCDQCETSWERDLFRNIFPSEVIERQDLMQNDASAMDVDNNALAKANRQESTDAFSKLTKDSKISNSSPEPVNSSGFQKGSYAYESILGLNEEFIDIKSLNLV